MDLTRFYQGLHAEVEKHLADPEMSFVLFYYTARKDGHVRIFDLHPYKGWHTVGESFVTPLEPLAPIVCPPTDCGIYVHVNYGMHTGPPDDVMHDFAEACQLTDVVSLGSTNKSKEVLPKMLEIISHELSPLSRSVRVS